MKNFIFGTATASYQIEGAAFSDGRGLSVWDVFCENKNNIEDASSGEIACNHYNLYRQDIELMSEMGAQAYRFSVSWPRVLPEGTGRVNSSGIDFYKRLVDYLLEKGIKPFVTLFHWDYPHALFQKGGFLNPDSSLWFEEYTEVVLKALGDMVKDYITINEPQCYIGLGHIQGRHAPGLTLSQRDGLCAVHNLLLSHGRAVRVIHGYNARAGFAPCAEAACPASSDADDIEAAKKMYFGLNKNSPWFSVSLYSDPIILGDYPQEYYAYFSDILPDIKQEDLSVISEPVDFYGQNIYSGYHIKSDGKGGAVRISPPPGGKKTTMGWDIVPECLYWAPKFLYERYNKPIFITENGVSFQDLCNSEGKINDFSRIEFIERYLNQLFKAKKEGVDIRGYFYWTLLDNFEWSRGYTQRFGLVDVDFKSLKRTPKQSFYWFKSLIETMKPTK